MEERVAEVPVLKFSEAEAVAADVRARWRNVLGDEPDKRDDLSWADLVQFVLGRARDRVAQREA